jgi:hypothetical protein
VAAARQPLLSSVADGFLTFLLPKVGSDTVLPTVVARRSSKVTGPKGHLLWGWGGGVGMKVIGALLPAFRNPKKKQKNKEEEVLLGIVYTTLHSTKLE